MEEENIYSYCYVSSSGSSGGFINSNFKVDIGGRFEHNGTTYEVTEKLNEFNFYIKIV